MSQKKGFKHSEESKIKMSCSRSGRPAHNKGKKQPSIAGENNPAKRLEVREKMRRSALANPHPRTGDKSNFWKGGIVNIDKIIRMSSAYKIWRDAVFLRDGFICQNENCESCGNMMGVKLNAHHKKPFSLYPELRFIVSNGITYCERYHHSNRKELHEEIKYGK